MVRFHEFIKKSLRVIAFIILALSSYPTYAFSLPTWWQGQNWRPILIAGGGTVTSADVGESKNFPIKNPARDEFFYYYLANQPVQTSGLMNAFLGIEWHFFPHWSLQAGVDYYQATPFLAKGYFLQGADLESTDTYHYYYSILARQALGEARLLYNFKERYHPYILLGLGAAFNKTYNFNTTAPRDLTFTRMYADNNNTSFTYSVGLGFDVDVTCFMRVGIGYRFVNLGQAPLGPAVIDTTNVYGTISQSHLYANQFLLQVTLLS